MDLQLLNGASKCTLIEDTRGEVHLIFPDRKRKVKYASVADAVNYVKEKGWEINVSHLAGPSGYGERMKGQKA